MKINSKYTIEDCIFIVEYLNKNRPKQSTGWYKFYAYFFYFNCFAFPAVLLILEQYLAGIIVFLFDLLIFVYLRDRIDKENLKTHFRNLFDKKTYKEYEIELFEEGIKFKSTEEDSFFQWNFIKEILETPDKIYLFTRTSGLTIAKNSFEFESNMHEFLIFAKARIPQKMIQ